MLTVDSPLNPLSLGSCSIGTDRRPASSWGATPLELGVQVLREFLATRASLSAASRARTHAALAGFLGWCYRHEHITADPIARIQRVCVAAPAPRGLAAGQVQKILDVILRARERDRLLFTLIASTGLRAGEALGIHVEDLDLRTDDEPRLCENFRW
jgi:integrase/recombinase XerD